MTKSNVMKADTEYDFIKHTHVTIDGSSEGLNVPPQDRQLWEGTHDIILHTGQRVWIGGCHMHVGFEGVIQVGDGTSKGFDDHGNCVLSIPASWCSYWDSDQAETIEKILEADAKLLSYARG